MNAASKEMAGNLARVLDRIERAAARSSRAAEEITLIAVSKTHSAARIHELYELGVRHFGENRVQEWESKRASLANLDATWHMIGHVQSNKSARVVRLFDSVDTLDDLQLAERLDRAEKDLNTVRHDPSRHTVSMKIGRGLGADSAALSPIFRAEYAENTESTEKRRDGENATGRLRVLIEVKLDPGPSKSGIDAEKLPLLAEAVWRFPHLELRGLMGVPPYFEDPEEARPYFRRLRELRDAVRAHAGREALPVLSMGMSHDFEVAIEEGATEIRVGTALFGERPRA
jgi:uncharacterized pyridoxal phosphate-containing UPF0001 family protein